MPIETSFEYDELRNILFAKMIGDMSSVEDAENFYQVVKTKQAEIREKCWFVSDVTDMTSKSAPAIHYSKLSSVLYGSRLATITIAKSLIQKTGMKLVGTFRREIIHLVSSREEAIEKIEKLKQGIK